MTLMIINVFDVEIYGKIPLVTFTNRPGLIPLSKTLGMSPYAGTVSQNYLIHMKKNMEQIPRVF